MLKENIAIAIDGPAGAGKSTIAKKIAETLNIEYIDTGAMYRALTLKVLNNNIDPNNIDEIIKIMHSTSIDFQNNHIYLDDVQVDKEIRTNIINNNVSYIAKIKEVRSWLVSIQQDLSKRKSVIMDGRDITTVVLKDAEFKFFVTASVEERATRRYKELKEKGEENISYEQIKSQIENRDMIDSSREVAPLIQVESAIKIDTTNKTIDECVNEIISIVTGR